ncbi:MAG: histidine kinase [Bacteroidota bacterium]
METDLLFHFRRHLQRLGHFLRTHTVWMLGTCLLLFSLTLTIEAQPSNLGTYVYHAVLLFFLFSPPLLFSLGRNYLRGKLPDWAVYLLWLLCFAAYPLLLFLSGLVTDEWVATWGGSLVPIIGLILFGTEVGILLNDFFLHYFRKHNWWKKLTLHRLMMAALLFAAVAGSVFGLVVKELWVRPDSLLSGIQTMGQIMWYACQIWIILMAFYAYHFINLRFLIPEILRKKGLVYYGFAVLATIMLFSPIFAQLTGLLPVVADFGMGYPDQARLFNIELNLNLPLFIIVLTTPFVMVFQWFTQSKDIVELEKAHSETELQLLKQQINPHFFFNTLNNLLALSLRKDKQTPEVILQLSDLMRYAIYKGKESWVSVSEEVAYLEDYIQLQRIRLRQELDFQFHQEVEHPDLQVPPLLLIILVENAFKHGIEPAEGPALLHISLEADAQTLHFSCRNSVEAGKTEASSPGIGLENLKRRLALRLPHQHALRLQAEPHFYEASLSLSGLSSSQKS